MFFRLKIAFSLHCKTFSNEFQNFYMQLTCVFARIVV